LQLQNLLFLHTVYYHYHHRRRRRRHLHHHHHHHHHHHLSQLSLVLKFKTQATAKHLERVAFLLLGHKFLNNMTGP
jgi:hypothetical protein